MESLGIASSREQLLPGLPDRITLGHIVPKLPWRAFHVLSSVSRRWGLTIRSRKAYGARVASDSTETLVIFNYAHSKDVIALALYSPTDNVYHRLPPIPQRYRGSLPWDCQFIALDGKVYVLGGKQQRHSRHDLCSDEVYELDIAGQRQWKVCASMEEGRESFGCGVLDGKIYVFGGSSDDDPVTVSEVYDPKVDAWSRIAPMKSYRFNHQVVTVGKELCMHGGLVRNADYFEQQEERLFSPGNWSRSDSDDYFTNLLEQTKNADSWEIYDPASDMWRVLQPPREGLPTNCFLRLFMVQGKFYTVSKLGVHLLEFDKWTHQGSLWCDALGPSHSVSIWPAAGLSVGDEILAMVQCYRRDPDGNESCFLLSRGFGSKDTEVVWQKLPCPLEFGYDSNAMCLIQL